MFRKIPEYPEYLINPQGDIFSTKVNRMLTPHVTANGYMRIVLTENKTLVNLLVHRILARVFKDLPSLYSELEVDHNDRNTLNNSLDNLIVRSREEHQTKTLKDRGFTHVGQHYCVACGVEVTNKSIHCMAHSPAFVVKNDEITADQIEYWVSNYSWVRAGKELGYSDNGLRKRYTSLTGKSPKEIKKNKVR